MFVKFHKRDFKIRQNGVFKKRSIRHYFAHCLIGCLIISELIRHLNPIPMHVSGGCLIGCLIFCLIIFNLMPNAYMPNPPIRRGLGIWHTDFRRLAFFY